MIEVDRPTIDEERDAAIARARRAAGHRRAKKLGTLIDKLYEARERRLEAQRKVDALKEKEGAAEAIVVAALQEAKLVRAAGAKASASIKPVTVGQVEPDRWPELHAYVRETGAFDLLQKRLNNGAVRERLEAGEKVPGVKIVQLLDLQLRKV